MQNIDRSIPLMVNFDQKNLNPRTFYFEFKDISNNKEFEDMYEIFTVFLKSIALQNKNIAL